MLKSNTPPRERLLPPEESPVAWGAAASATVGSVTVELDEALTTPERQLSLDTPAVYLRLKIDGPDTIARLHEFLTAPGSEAAMDFALGMHGPQEVRLLRDDEPGRRIFIVIGACEKSALRLTLSDEECRQWAEAIEDVRDQLRG